VIEVLLLSLSVPIGLGAGVWFQALAPQDGLASHLGALVAGLAEASPVLAGLAVLALGVGPAQPGVLAMAWSLLLVPRLVRSTGRALDEVDPGLRRAAEGLGVTPWESLHTLVLPAAAPRLAGLVLRDLARTLGELAPLFLFAAVLAPTPLVVSNLVVAATLAWVVAANVAATVLERLP
jgi:ABC-type phosphate transport system permease subunit